MILSQLVEADEMMSLSPEELREMICRLDEEVVNGTTEAPTVPLGAQDAAGQPSDEASSAKDES